MVKLEDRGLAPAVLEVSVGHVDVDAELARLERLADTTATLSLSPRTRAAYESDWRQWVAWCHRHDLAPLPVDAADVRLYLVDMATSTKLDGTPRFKASTIERHLASISRYRFESGGDKGLARDERVSTVMNGIKRDRREPPRRRAALLLDDVRAMVEEMDHSSWPSGVGAARDTLAILLGFSTAMRRSEVAGLTIGQVTRVPSDGLHVRLTSSKTDQVGHGVVLAVPFGTRAVTCVPCAWIRWTRLSAAVSRPQRMRLVFDTPPVSDWEHVCRGAIPVLDSSSPLLVPVSKDGAVGRAPMTGSALNAILKRRLPAGYDPDPYGFHSLRAGFVTQARRNGADTRSVRRQTRHSSDSMVDVYDREQIPLKDNAVNLLGL